MDIFTLFAALVLGAILGALATRTWGTNRVDYYHAWILKLVRTVGSTTVQKAEGQVRKDLGLNPNELTDIPLWETEAEMWEAREATTGPLKGRAKRLAEKKAKEAS